LCAINGATQLYLCARYIKLPKYETAVCKVLFQLTKVSRNDDAFFDVGAVEPMLSLLEAQSHQLNHINSSNISSSGGSDGSSGGSSGPNNGVVVPIEAPVYLVGALKNISSSTEAAQQRLGKLGAISVLCGLLRHCLNETMANDNPNPTPNPNPTEETTQLTVQLLTHVTGTLRNLSLAKVHHKQVASSYICNAYTCVHSFKPFVETHQFRLRDTYRHLLVFIRFIVFFRRIDLLHFLYRLFSCLSLFFFSFYSLYILSLLSFSL